jgi:urease accessory protein
MTSIRIAAGDGRPRLEFRGDTIVPRLAGYGPMSARFTLVAGGALLLGGDEVSIDVTVGAGCLLELEDAGGTVAYDADGVQSRWAVTVRVEDGGTLIWQGLPLVIADGANVVRSTQVMLGRNAVVCLRETLVLGRAGEQGGRIRQRTDVEQAGVPVFVEDLAAVGSQGVPGILGGHRVVDTLLLAGLRAPGPVGQVLQMESPGTLGRFLGAATHQSPISASWTQWKAQVMHRSVPSASERQENSRVNA